MRTEPRLGCGAVLIRDGSLLLLQRLNPPEALCWGLPGGKVDWLEPVEQAVIREVSEETGLRIHSLHLLCVVDQIDAEGGDHWVAPVYLSTDTVGEARLVEPEKHGGIGWFPLSALPQPLTTATRVAVAALERHSGRAMTDIAG